MPWAFFDCAWLKVCDIMGLCVTVAGVDWLSIFLFGVLGLVPNLHIRWLRSTVTPVPRNLVPSSGLFATRNAQGP